MKTSVVIAVLFAACAAQSQNLKLVTVRFGANGPSPNSIQFLCSEKYDKAECVKEATAVRQVLAT